MDLAIRVVIDFVCPWCWIGTRRLRAARAGLAAQAPQHALRTYWLPYFLNPDTPPAGEPYLPFLERKFGSRAAVKALQARVVEAGANAGVRFDFPRIAVRASTLAAHRLVQRAQRADPADHADALADALFVAYFERGENIGEVEVLAQLAARCGDDAAAVRAYLAGDEDAEAVRALAAQAQRAGIDSVPFFVFGERHALAGAHEPEAFSAALSQALAEPHHTREPSA